MNINSVIVGIQYHNGVKALNKGDEVELSFNGADDEFPTGIRVLTNDGVVIGNIINNMNHPSVDMSVVVENDIKNNNNVRKITTTDCKATVVAIKRYVVFITIHTDILVDNNNGDDNMKELEEKIEKLEEKIEENREQRHKLKKERIQMKKELKQLKEQLEEVENNTNEVVEETTDVEEKIKTINKETITQSVMERSVKPMTLELMQDGLLEAFNKAKEEYPMEAMMYSMQYIDLHPIANTIMTLRSIDDLIAQRYLQGEVSGGEFDHMRVHIGIHSYFYYEHIIEEVTMDEFFTTSSLEASKKFLKEEEEKERKMNKEVI